MRVVQEHICYRLHGIEKIRTYEVQSATIYKSRFRKAAEKKLNQPDKTVYYYKVFGYRRPIA